MKDILDEYLPAELTEEQVFSEIIQEVYSKSRLWAGDPEKLEFSIEIATLLSQLEFALTLANNPAKAAHNAFKLAAEISKFGGPDLVEKIYQDSARKAANARHANRQTLYARAFEIVKLELDGNCYQEWTHADFLNFILNKTEFSGLSVTSLRDGIRNIFKDLGLNDRIAKGKAKHCKRNK